MDKTGKNLAEYNVRNGQYQIGTGDVKPLTYLAGLTLSRAISEQKFYGDGDLQDILTTEPNITGSLVLTARDEDFEKDLGYIEDIEGGTASSLVKTLKTANIYCEVYHKEAGQPEKVKKLWLLNARVSPAGESYTQSGDSITVNNAEYPLSIIGVNRKTADGTSDYIDPTTGDTKKEWKMSSIPTDTGYDTFGDTVPVPKAKTV